MRPLRAAATTLVAMLALSACNGGDDPDEPKATSTPSEPTSAPSTTPPVETPTEPALPKAATKATEAGARAFIAYYWDLINYAQVTGDVNRLKAVSGPNCAGCNAGIKAVEELYRDGGHAEGGDYAVKIVKLEDVAFEREDAYAFESTVTVRNDEQTVIDGDGSTKTLTPTTNEIVVYTLWVKAHWRLDVLVVQ